MWSYLIVHISYRVGGLDWWLLCWMHCRQAYEEGKEMHNKTTNIKETSTASCEIKIKAQNQVSHAPSCIL